MREVDITPATSTSQEEDEPLQTNFIDENLSINMEELNGSMEVIHEPMKIIPGDHTYCLPNNSTPCYACHDKSNLVKALVSKINKLTLEKKQLKYRSITEAVVQRCSVKKVFLKILQNSKENTCARVSFLIKLQLY